jgi:hypothetical protein
MKLYKCLSIHVHLYRCMYLARVDLHDSWNKIDYRFLIYGKTFVSRRSSMWKFRSPLWTSMETSLYKLVIINNTIRKFEVNLYITSKYRGQQRIFFSIVISKVHTLHALITRANSSLLLVTIDSRSMYL